MMTETELLELKGEITEAKGELGTLKGRKETLLEQLQEKWKVKTPAEAKKKLIKMQAEIDKLDGEIKTATVALEKQLEDAV
jgi:HAMP domain-containing protein